MLPARIQKKARRARRWRSPAHCNFVRSHACCNCGSTAAIEAAHVRLGSGAGIGQKPDDWRVVSLCHDCHQGGGNAAQHTIGEPTFWARFQKRTGNAVEDLIGAFIKASPKRREIELAQKDRTYG